MPVICDTDFLSAILKIKKTDLVLDFFDIKKISVPVAVLREISETNLIEKIPQQKVEIKKSRVKFTSEELGAGEVEAINLARSLRGILLSNDKKAIEFARDHKVKAYDLFSFLLACKKKKKLTKKALKEIIQNLKDKDHLDLGKDRERILLNN